MQLEILPDIAAAYMLVFARIGTLVTLLPGLGEGTIPVRARLSVALLLAFVYFPLARPYYPADVVDMATLPTLLIAEVIIGIVLGVTGRLMISSLQVAGNAIAYQMGLAFVQAVDPTQGQQSALVGTFLTIAGLTLVFTSELHHIALAALGDSYLVFPPGTMPLSGDAARYVTGLVSSTFKLGIQIAAPVLVFGVVFNVGLGLLARMMPQMQVFFVALPASMLLGYAILALTLAAMLGVFAEAMAQALASLRVY